MTVRIITDSTSDMNAERAESLGVYLVPLRISFGDEEFIDSPVPSEFDDGKPMGAEEFWSRLETSPEIPTTSQPSPNAFHLAFEKAAMEGADEIVCIVLSSGLSKTVDSANLAKREFGDKIPVHIIDSKSASAGLCLLVEKAQEMANSGSNAAQIRSAINELVPKVRVFFSPDSLDQLKRGGRIGGARALLATALSIKPILGVDQEGKVDAIGKVRTRSKVITDLLQRADSSTADAIYVLSSSVNKPSGPTDYRDLVHELQTRHSNSTTTRIWTPLRAKFHSALV